MAINFSGGVFSSPKRLAEFLRDKPLVEELRKSAIRDNQTEETKNFRNAYQKWAINTAVTFPVRSPIYFFLKSVQEISQCCYAQGIAEKSGGLAERVRLKSFDEDSGIYGLPGNINMDYDSWMQETNTTFCLFKTKNRSNSKAQECLPYIYKKSNFPEDIQKIIVDNSGEEFDFTTGGVCGGIAYRFLYLYLSAARYDHPVHRIKKLATYFKDGGDVLACILNKLKKASVEANEVTGIEYDQYDSYVADKDTVAAAKAKANQKLTKEAYCLRFACQINGQMKLHGVAYIKVSEHLGCLLEPNQGLIFCKSKDHFSYFVRFLQDKWKLGEDEKFCIIPCELKWDYQNDVIKGVNQEVPVFSHAAFGLF